MPVQVAKFERMARSHGVIPTALKHSTPHGSMRFAESYHHADPEHVVAGVIVPGWKTMWFMDRGGADYYGVLWFRNHIPQADRFAAAKLDAVQFIADNVQTGRYR